MSHQSKSDQAKSDQAKSDQANEPNFRDFGLPETLIQALNDVGYESPTPIQTQAIPHLMKGLDLLGHAPTGTGKTAAFALPLLSRINIEQRQVQLMVLAPTRELAIQVAEALQKYSAHLPGFHVVPIYGGQEYGGQIRQLRRGVHAVVGTPGRVMDHMRRGTLRLESLAALVLDEADEMLRMGFIDDVEWILTQIPDQRQMALFSATMPKEIQRIARQYLRDPQSISIATKASTADNIRQRYWSVKQTHKLDALTRILEVEVFEAMLIFVRTRIQTTELAEKLTARGFSAAALNGDMQQKLREQKIKDLSRGGLDILVATDVAARGLDVSRISHVVNYDIPNDTEAYIHRIGRTGRAGRPGDAILFVAPREQRMLAAIERATRQKIERLELPTTEMVNSKRVADFKQSITDTLANSELDFMRDILTQYQQEHDVPSLDIAAALATRSLGEKSLLVSAKPAPEGAFEDGARSKPTSARNEKTRERRPAKKSGKPPAEDMEQFRIEVGKVHDVQPGNIVGAIANEAGLDSEHIGHIEIHEDHSLIELPLGMPKPIFKDLKKVWVCGRQLNITRMKSGAKSSARGAATAGREKPRGKKKPKSGKSANRRRTAPVKPDR